MYQNKTVVLVVALYLHKYDIQIFSQDIEILSDYWRTNNVIMKCDKPGHDPSML